MLSLSEEEKVYMCPEMKIQLFCIHEFPRAVWTFMIQYAEVRFDVAAIHRLRRDYQSANVTQCINAAIL